MTRAITNAEMRRAANALYPGRAEVAGVDPL